MKAKHRIHDANFKARVALEAIKGVKTIQEIAKEFEVHPVQVSDWKKVVLERASNVFEPGACSGQSDEEFERERSKLQAKIGELTVELDFLRKKSKQLGLRAGWPSCEEKDHPNLSIRAQCELLGVARSTLDYQVPSRGARQRGK